MSMSSMSYIEMPIDENTLRFIPYTPRSFKKCNELKSSKGSDDLDLVVIVAGKMSLNICIYIFTYTSIINYHKLDISSEIPDKYGKETQRINVYCIDDTFNILNIEFPVYLNNDFMVRFTYHYIFIYSDS